MLKGNNNAIIRNRVEKRVGEKDDRKKFSTH